MTTSPAFVELRARGAIGWVRADLAAVGLEAFWAPLVPLAGAKGRGGIGLLQVQEHDLVVRPYRRGGALGRLLQDRYAGPSRARRELELLAALRNEGVPVVFPVAAVARRGRAFWRLRPCTELLPELPSHLILGKPVSAPTLMLADLDVAIGKYLVGVHNTAYALLAYAKNAQTDMTPDERRAVSAIAAARKATRKEMR